MLDIREAPGLDVLVYTDTQSKDTGYGCNLWTCAGYCNICCAPRGSSSCCLLLQGGAGLWNAAGTRYEGSLMVVGMMMKMMRMMMFLSTSRCSPDPLIHLSLSDALTLYTLSLSLTPLHSLSLTLSLALSLSIALSISLSLNALSSLVSHRRSPQDVESPFKRRNRRCWNNSRIFFSLYLLFKHLSLSLISVSKSRYFISAVCVLFLNVVPSLMFFKFIYRAYERHHQTTPSQWNLRGLL